MTKAKFCGKLTTVKTESVRIDTELLRLLKELKSSDGHPIMWHLNRAIRNYLKAKKLLNNKEKISLQNF